MLLDVFQALCASNTAQLKTKPGSTTFWKALSGHYLIRASFVCNTTPLQIKGRTQVNLSIC